MRSGTSFFNGTVWKKTFLRFWPVWGANLVFWLLVLPLRGLLALQDDAAYGGDSLWHFSRSLGEFGGKAGVACGLILGLMAAMAVCSHLYSARSANFMGALPVRREGLFLSHYLSGLAMLVLPNLAVFVLTLLVELAGGAAEPLPLLFWLGALSGNEFFFYSFAVCIGMFTGHLLALPVFYGIFNVLVMAVYALLEWVMSVFYYGYAGWNSAWEIVTWLTPTVPLSEVRMDADSFGYTVENGGWLAIYAVAAAVLTAAALLLYRRRQMETAGDVISVRVMRPVFKYGVAVCAGLFFGFVTHMILGLDTPGLMVSMVLWAIAGYFVARMLLDKTFRVFRKWKGAAVVTAVFVALFLMVGFDLTGYETRVPDPARVASVEVEGLHSWPYDSASYIEGVFDDPAVIEKVTDIHRAVVENRLDWTVMDDWRHLTLELTYTMTDGSRMSRDYSVEFTTGADDPVWLAVEALLSDRDFLWEVYGFGEAEAAGELFYAQWDGENFYEEDAAALLEAVRQDFAAGRIGVRSYDQYQPNREEPDFLLFIWQMPTENAGYSYTKETEVSIAVPDTAVSVLALLEELADN